MNRDTYLRTALGFWSSHPTYVARRSRYACLLALLPLAIFLGWFGFRVRRAGNWFEMLNSIGTWLVVAAVVLSFTIAALVTFALMTRLNRWQHISKHWSLDHQHGLSSAGTSRPRVAPDGWILIPAVVIGFAGPFFAAMYLGSGNSSSTGSTFAVWMFRSLAFLPLFALLSITGIGGDVVDDPSLKRQRRGWLLALSLCLGIVALVMIARDSFVLIGNDHWADIFGRVLPKHESLMPFVPGFLFGVAATIAYIGWRHWTTNSTSLERKARSVMDAQRLTSLLGELLHSEPDDSSGGGVNGRPIPEWLLPILSAIQNSDPTASPTASDLQWLFAHPVSQRAMASLQAAVGATSRLVQSDEVSRDHSLADSLLVYADNETETDLLVAFAVYQVIIRGQRVLWMIPSADDREAISQAVDRSLARIAMSGLIRAGFVRSTSASDFAADPATLPHILLATPEHWHDFVWNNVTIDIADRRRFIQALPVVCIGHLNRFSDSQQSTLIGQAIAHRILNCTAGSFVQIAICTDSNTVTLAKDFLHHVSAKKDTAQADSIPTSLLELLPSLTPVYPNTEATIQLLGSLPGMHVEENGDARTVAPLIYLDLSKAVKN